MTKNLQAVFKKNKRNIVVFINPPNYQTIEPAPSLELANPYEHSDWSNYPSMGILVLASAVSEKCSGIDAVYIDGNVINIKTIISFLSENCSKILAVCVSCLTATYSPGLELLRICKSFDPCITTIIGNDHFTALATNIMHRRNDIIDFGFIGNEVVGPMCNLINQLYKFGKVINLNIAGLSYWKDNRCVMIKQQPEKISSNINYSLIDQTYMHSKHYKEAFKRVYALKIKKWLGIDADSGIALEIARGCIKFNKKNACTFCSISQHGMQTNSIIDPRIAWNMLETAFQNGYNYAYITADELPLTFNKLLRNMRSTIPSWFSESRMALTGYCRADALSVYHNATLLSDLGYRVMMVGIDAGPQLSLKAVNKAFNDKSIDKLFSKNLMALEQARKVGIKVRIGFVVGHIGMTSELLSQNISYFKNLVSEYSDVICTADVEILSPEPGSMDYRYLTEPSVALEAANKLGLALNSITIREMVASRWKDKDILQSKNLISDYVLSVMPELTVDTLINARKEMRETCKDFEINIGEEDNHKTSQNYYANV